MGYWGGATAFSQVDLFSEYDIISHASYPPPSWTHKKISYFTVQLFKMADELDSSSSEFSPIQVPLFLILLWNKVFWKVKLRIVAKKQLTLNAKVLMVNGENHQRQKLMELASTKLLNIRTAGGFISVGFSLTKRLRMWIANYGNDFRNRPEWKPSKSAGKSLYILQVKNNSRISIFWMLASAENLQPQQTSATKIMYLKIEEHHFL